MVGLSKQTDKNSNLALDERTKEKKNGKKGKRFRRCYWHLLSLHVAFRSTFFRAIFGGVPCGRNVDIRRLAQLTNTYVHKTQYKANICLYLYIYVYIHVLEYILVLCVSLCVCVKQQWNTSEHFLDIRLSCVNMFVTVTDSSNTMTLELKTSNLQV